MSEAAKLTSCLPHEEELFMRLRIYPPDRRRRDSDNVLKCLLDSLEKGGAYLDDNQVKDNYYSTEEVRKHGQIVIDLHPKDRVKVEVTYV